MSSLPRVGAGRFGAAAFWPHFSRTAKTVQKVGPATSEPQGGNDPGLFGIVNNRTPAGKIVKKFCSIKSFSDSKTLFFRIGEAKRARRKKKQAGQKDVVNSRREERRNKEPAELLLLILYMYVI